MDGRTDGLTDRQTDRRTDRWIDRWMDRHIDRHMDRQTSRLTGWQTDCFILSQTVNVTVNRRSESILSFNKTTEMSEVIAIILMNIVLNVYIKEKIICLTYVQSTYLL